MSEEVTQSLGGGGLEPTRRTAPLDGGTRSAGAPLPAHGAPIPARIGRYTVVRVLGEGGMGTVYEAEQESPRRAVALKVIRAGCVSAEMLRRFAHESAVLGRLQHPGIAQVYEAGTVQDERGHPVPFFAMEFIRGVPLTEFAASKRLGTRERLELVARICDAVYHAHQKGVIHRDLKPGNILVDESGQPKILDFGVARATDSDIQTTTLQTDVGQLIGTVPYMSPEQVGGDPSELDTRSDVYALGVIAYELLAGRLPYDLRRKAIHEAARVIREEEPTRLSAINRTLRGDVDTLVAKALEKERGRRYQSAESFASDIRRYLKHEPIAARPASTWYQAARFARRNRGLVAGLALAFVLLIAGLIGTSIGLGRATKAKAEEESARREADAQRDAAIAARNAEAAQRKEAESQRDKAEKIGEFMSDTLKGVGPSVACGRDITMLREMMDTAAARIEKGELRDAPEAELGLRMTIGYTYKELALYPESARMLEPTVAMARLQHDEDHADTGNAQNYLAQLLQARGDLAGAELLFREALGLWKRLFPGDDSNIATGLNNLAILLQERGDLVGAEPLLRESLDMRKRLFPGDHTFVANSLNGLASLLKARGDLEGAERLYLQALDMRKRLFPGDHPDVANSLNNLSQILGARGDLAEAETACREGLEMWKRLFPGDHPSVVAGLSNLASLLQTRGDLAGAEPLSRQALEMSARLFRGDHAVVATGLNNLAQVLQARGDLAGAEALYRQALEMNTRLFSGDHPVVAAGLNNLALVLQDRGDLAGAEPLFRESLEMRKRLFPGDHPEVASGLSNRARLLQARGDLEGAEALLRESLEMRKRLFTGDHPDVAESLNNLGSLLYARGDLAGAEPFFREALEMWKRQYSGDHPVVATGLNNLAALLTTRGDTAGAEPLFRESLEMRKRLYPGDHPEVADSQSNLAILLRTRGDLAGAEPLFRQSLEMRRRVLPPGHSATQSSLANLADLLDRLAKAAEAEPLWRELLDLRTTTLPPGHWGIASVRVRLGGSLVSQRKFAEAEAPLIEGYEGLAAAKDTPRTPSDYLREACERVVKLYESWDKAEPGKGYDVKAAEWKLRLDSDAATPEKK